MPKYHAGQNPRDRADASRIGQSRSTMPWLLGILALLIVGGFVLAMVGGMNADRTAEPSGDRPATTGAATSDPTGAKAPAKSRAGDPTGANRSSGPSTKQ